MERVLPNMAMKMLEPRPQEPEGDEPDSEEAPRAAMFTAPAPQKVDSLTWRKAIENRMRNGLLRVGSGGRFVPIPDNVTPQMLRIVAYERSRGNLPHVSLVKMHEVGIDRSRDGSPSPASYMLDFLAGAQLIKDIGERRPYEWTEDGMITFPDYTALPSFISRHYSAATASGGSVAGVASVAGGGGW